jgi:splicing factor 3B subunit 3
MHLYGVTLQRASAITCAIYGNFSAPKAHEIVVGRGKLLELLRPDENGKVQSILCTEVFGIVRSLAPFRLTGTPTAEEKKKQTGKKKRNERNLKLTCTPPFSFFSSTGGNRDYIIVGSDSGRIVILEYNPNKNRFDKVHQETFGKSGCRRIVPGEYLAVDPKGRAAMIGTLHVAAFSSNTGCFPFLLFFFFLIVVV